MKRARITEAFRRAKEAGRGAFVAYMTAGYPTLEASEAAVDELVADGADIIELGVPCSDPFADGSVIRSAAYEAIRQGMDLDGTIAMARRLRSRHPDTGIVLFSYFKPVSAKGLKSFVDDAAEAGVDAVLIVDIPLEEREELLALLRPRGLGYIPLFAPDTPIEGVREIASGLENSFLYVITVKGVTGARAELPADLPGRLEAIRAISPIPVAAGFGISTRSQADEVSRHADGFIVGSALVKRLSEGLRPCLG